jgi:C-terminal processing protease CtpA/Prc
MARKSTLRTLARIAIPTISQERALPAVRPLLKSSVGVAEFFASVEGLSRSQQTRIIDQAIMMLEGFYAHLPLKRAMYALDPLQRLRLLRQRLHTFNSAASFHREMTSIFTSLNDLHTNYCLPAPFKDANAWLPFKVESYCGIHPGGDPGCAPEHRTYLVTSVAEWFNHPTFRRGVELLYWNGIPIARAVGIAAAQSAGGNAGARHAKGLAALTARPLIVSPPPDEEWVIVRFRNLAGRIEEMRVQWHVTEIPDEIPAKKRGVSLATERIRKIGKFLFAPEIIQFERRLAASRNPLSLLKKTESLLPDVFDAREVRTPHGKFGYIRIRTFDVDEPDDLVSEFLRLVRLLPQKGLILDVRDNGGGRSAAAERLLQLISPRQPIEPARFYFINTPFTLRLCKLQKANKDLGPAGLSPWIQSIQRSMETGATFSASFPYTDPITCNSIGRQYPGPAIVITNSLCYSATEFFAAVFQDHGGIVLGVDQATGGGGANVRTHEELRSYFRKDRRSPFKTLPNQADLRVAFRRSVRVGPATAGNDIEDFGVTPNYFHAMTRNDLLRGNVDLINHAARLLAALRAAHARC